jgi:hypothetical protein
LLRICSDISYPPGYEHDDSDETEEDFMIHKIPAPDFPAAMESPLATSMELDIQLPEELLDAPIFRQMLGNIICNTNPPLVPPPPCDN